MRRFNPTKWTPIMLNATLRTVGLGICLLALVATPAWADAAEEFQTLFGAELDRVRHTPDPADDLALAQTLLKAAEQSEDKPELRAVLIGHAFDLSLKSPDGADTTARAIDLSGATGAERLAMLEKVADARQTHYGAARGDTKAAMGESLINALVEAGDAARDMGDAERASVHYRKAMGAASALKSPMAETVKARYEHANYLRRVDLQIDAAKRRIKANSNDKAAAAELINLYLVEKDDPAEARKYTFLADDEKTADRVKLASSDPASLSEENHFELGGWYRELADDAKSQPSRYAMLRRAQSHYDHYLELHTAADPYRTAATAARDAIADELAAAGDTANPAPTNSEFQIGRWVDILARTDPAKHARRGDWVRSGDKLNLRAAGMAQIMMPVATDGSYEISVKFERDGGTGFGIYLPIKDSGVLLTAGYEIRGRFIVHGLSRVDKKEVNDRDNPSRSDGALGDLEGAKVLQIKVQIKGDEVAIAGSLNGKGIVTWSGPISSLDAHAIATSRNATAPGLFSWNAGLVIHSAKLKMTSGSAEWIKDGDVREVPPGEGVGGDLAEGIGDAIRRAAEDGAADWGRGRRPGGFPGRPGRN